MIPTSRRSVLRSSLALSALGACGAPMGEPLRCEPDGPDPFAGGTFLRTVPFTGEPARTFGEPYGVGWDGRLLYDLALVDQQDGITPNDQFYVRTEEPDLLSVGRDDWRIRVQGRVARDVDLTVDDLLALSAPQGEVLLECSGNTDSGQFGLMSAATWAGAAVLDVLDRHVERGDDATRVLISGFDEHSVPSNNGHSTPGAAWIFTLDQLAEFGGFLALEMNGVALPPDHGFPVRLVMPRWYGCTCIKWVDSIRLVGDDEPATSQMVEFAARTHQPGVPELARDYVAAAMQRSAMPVRIEAWEVDGQIAYRIVGIAWGGDGDTGRLVIGLNGEEAAVSVCGSAPTPSTWSRWVHRFDPVEAGEVLVTMRVDDPLVPQIRLDRGWYDRTFVVDPLS